MRFEYIVLLIIAFNVISAVAQRRAKKARDAEAARPGGAVDPSPAGGEWDDEDDAFTPSGTRPRHAEEDMRRARREAVASAPEPRQVERMPSLGRDILDQLARDLGLKVPRPEAPPPPRPASPSPVPVAARAESPEELRERLRRRERELEAESVRAREKIREWERLSASRSRGSSSPVPTGSAASKTARPSAPVPVRAHGVETARRPDLKDARRLREAIIMKEILDAPLARRASR